MRPAYSARSPALARAPWAVAAAAATLAGPAALDGALFGPLAGLAVSALVAPAGLLALALLPLGPEPSAPVPSAAPAHVLALLAGGAVDSGRAMPAPAWAGAGAIGLGGLWSRRLGPHRAVWSWDVVEVAAVDLWTSDIAADHRWGSGGAPRGAHWGGGGLRLFRVGLAASHHHLSASGALPQADTWILPQSTLSGAAAAALVATSRLPPQPALRAAPSMARPPLGPWAPGEGALAVWGAALLAPSGGALAAWGVWLAPAYLAAGLGALGRAFVWPTPHSAEGAQPPHSPLAPLAHAMGGGLPWAPSSPLGRPRAV